MRLAFSAALLGLAWFAAINIACSACAWLGARILARRRGTPAADTLLFVRLLPAGAATLFAAAIFLPAHLRFEPAEPDESFGVLLVLLAVVGLGLLWRSGSRAFTVGAAAVRVRRSLRSAGIGGSGACWEIADFPGLSLAGVFRTRVLIGSHVRRALTSDELDVAIAHEHAHRRSHDNLKRCAMFCAPDLFGWSAAAQQIEERWRAQAECLADTRAVGGDDRRAVHLASALVKVARLGEARGGPPASPVWSTFHEPHLEARVRRLVGGPAPAAPGGPATAPIALALALGAALVAAYSDTAYEIHLLTEVLIGKLP